MLDFADLEQRIDDASTRLASSPGDAALLREIEDLLAEGYIRALQSDQRRRRLQQRRDAMAVAAEDAHVIAREERIVSEATRELRLRLAVIRERWYALAGNAPA